MPEWSAVIDGFNVKQYPIPGDHIDMCKFGTRGDAGYKRVTFLIKSIIKKEFQGKSGNNAEQNPVPNPHPQPQLLPEPERRHPSYPIRKLGRDEVHMEVEEA